MNVFSEVAPNTEMVFNIIILTVLASTFLHGASAVPLANWYGDRADEMADEPDMVEMESIDEMPKRSAVASRKTSAASMGGKTVSNPSVS